MPTIPPAAAPDPTCAARVLTLAPPGLPCCAPGCAAPACEAPAVYQPGAAAFWRLTPLCPTHLAEALGGTGRAAEVLGGGGAENGR